MLFLGNIVVGAPITGNDFAILVLKTEVVRNNKTKIAKLPEENDPCPDGNNLIISGWGRTWEGPPEDGNWYLPTALKIVSVGCLDTTKHCPKYDTDANILCLGDVDYPFNSACAEDVGGTKTIIEQF